MGDDFGSLGGWPAGEFHFFKAHVTMRNCRIFMADGRSQFMKATESNAQMISQSNAVKMVQVYDENGRGLNAYKGGIQCGE